MEVPIAAFAQHRLAGSNWRRGVEAREHSRIYGKPGIVFCAIRLSSTRHFVRALHRALSALESVLTDNSPVEARLPLSSWSRDPAQFWRTSREVRMRLEIPRRVRPETRSGRVSGGGESSELDPAINCFRDGKCAFTQYRAQ